MVNASYPEDEDVDDEGLAALDEAAQSGWTHSMHLCLFTA